MESPQFPWFTAAAFLAFAQFPLSSQASAAVDVSAVENVKPALPKIPPRTFSLSDYGAVGDGKTLNTDAFKNAIEAVRKAGGGKLVIPAGTYRTQPFTLCSSLDLHLEQGAVIQAPDTFGELGLPDPTSLHSQAEVAEKVHVPPPLISGRDLHDVSITGLGTIDGNGAHWWAWSERAERNEHGRLIYPRPHLVVINGCKRLYIADITLTNSSKFHLVPSNIVDLTIERVKVLAPFNAPNTDAIDPGPVTNALIRECNIDTGDDDIAIKTGGTNVLIENCTIKHGHGISIGSNTDAGVHNMLVRHCTMTGSDNGIRIKSMVGAGGPVENVRYTDIQMDGVRDTLTLDLTYVDNNRPNFKGEPGRIPSIHNIQIDHVTSTHSKNAGKIIGLSQSPIKDIVLSDISITAENDLRITDAENPILTNVTRNIQPNVFPVQAKSSPLPTPATASAP